MNTLAASLPNGQPKVMWLFGVGLFLALFGPLYWDAAQGLWTRDEHAHGPLIFMVAAWFAWQQRDRLFVTQPPGTASALPGWALLVLGCLMFFLGRLLKFSIIEFGAQIVVGAGLLTLLGGWPAVRLLWFPLFFLLFMIPLPGVLVDAATGALKQWVSVVAEHLLALCGYPVGRVGVMLVVGQYQMMVADACSGLHSMFTLSSMGILLMYLCQRASVVHNVVMLLAILPIAFVANILRVMVLVLVTYHLGDEAGQGFLHGAAGIVLTVAALLFFIAFDGLLVWVSKVSHKKTERISA